MKELEYKLIDMANGEKLEKWGEYLLIRPDPQIVWDKKSTNLWKDAHARYIRSKEGGGYWEKLRKMKDSWSISYGDLKFNLKPMGFKHTGLFPEQHSNWDYIDEVIKKSKKKVKVLNLFAYTGGATIAAANAGASVCHVDSSVGMISWAKENIKLNNLEKAPVRFIVDDVIKFVKREIRRENKYDIIIMDPPSYGRGKNGEVWSIEKDLCNLIDLCSQLLTDDAICFMVNTYTGGLSGKVIENILHIYLKKDMKEIRTKDIGIKMENSELFLPCGITTIWQNK